VAHLQQHSGIKYSTKLVYEGDFFKLGYGPAGVAVEPVR
jgi:hypothetical protein